MLLQEFSKRHFAPYNLHDILRLILHDPMRPHKAGISADLTRRYVWKVLPHLPYGPDMGPPDLDLLPKLKEPLHY
jgi:hypothetical protein